MNDGSITFSTELDNKELEQQLSSLKKKIMSVEDKISQMQAERMPLVDQSRQLGAELDAANAKLHEMQSAAAGAFSPEQISDQTLRVNGLQAEWNRVQGRVERYDTDIANSSIELDRNKEKAGEVASELASAGYNAEKMGKATEKAHKSMGRFALRVREVVRSALVFTLITQALAQFREWIGKVIKTNAQASAAVAKLKAALLTLAQPLVDVIIPAFTTFVNILTTLLTQLAKVVSFVFGTTFDQSKKAAEALNDQTNALDETGEAAKKASKSLANFDEINKIGGETDSTNSENAPDFAGIGGMDANEYKTKIDEITAYVSGALLALGAILTFSGANIPLGLGLMALGAAGLAYEVKEHWGDVDGKVKSAVNTILMVMGTSLLVLGAVLTFSGVNVPLGIGLMLVGAASLATAAALNWDYVQKNLQTVIANLLAIVAAAALIIGIVFLFTGHVKIGLGLLLVSALSYWGAQELGFDWNSIPVEVKTVIANTLAAVAAGALVLGIIFLFSGHVGAGLGLLLASALAYYGATEAGFNWGSIPDEVRTTIANVLAAVALGALVFGAIFLLSGHVGAGLGLILAAALSYWGATEAGFDWNTMPAEMREKISNVLTIIADASLVFGAILLFTGNVAMGLGLLIISAMSYWGATEAGVDWNVTVAKVRNEIEIMLSIIAGAALVIGVILLLAGHIPLGIALIGMSAASFFGLVAVSSDATWNSMTKKVKGSLDGVESEINSHRNSMRAESEALGTGISDGLSSGVDAGSGRVGSAVTGALESGISAGDKAMDIHSPSGVAQEQGNQIVAGWVLALENGKASVSEKVTEVMATIKSAVLASQTGVVDAFKSVFDAAVNSFPSKIFGSTPVLSAVPYSIPSIPTLATGAVIPPNREFMAVLGDQKSGNNVEAPEELIRRIVREESGSGDITINLTEELDGEVIFRNQKKISRRHGESLVEA